MAKRGLTLPPGEDLRWRQPSPPASGGLTRTQLLYGVWPRRERRRIDARAHLRAAAETFGALGAADRSGAADPAACCASALAT